MSGGEKGSGLTLEPAGFKVALHREGGLIGIVEYHVGDNWEGIWRYKYYRATGNLQAVASGRPRYFFQHLAMLATCLREKTLGIIRELAERQGVPVERTVATPGGMFQLAMNIAGPECRKQLDFQLDRDSTARINIGVEETGDGLQLRIWTVDPVNMAVYELYTWPVTYQRDGRAVYYPLTGGEKTWMG